MYIHPRNLDADQLYKVLSGLVIPRPIALITSLDEDGRVNAAPYSFFNILTDDPPVLAFGCATKPGGVLKDTPSNIERTAEFVVNLVGEKLAEGMAICAVDFPRGVEELHKAGLSCEPSQTVAVPRIAGALAALECSSLQSIQLSERSRIVLGKVRTIHVAEGCMDPVSRRVDMQAYQPIGRLFGDHYVRLTDMLTVGRMNHATWLLKNPAASA